MANIVNPNLPADLPTDWTTSQYVSPNGSEVSLSQQHGYNYLMEQVNAAQTAVNTLAEQAQEAVSGLESGALTATATRSGTTVAITGPEDAVTVTFLAPADWTEGDSYTYNGTPITVTDLNGNPVTDGWKQGAVLTFQISGGVAYFVGGASGSFLPLSGGTMTGPAVGAPGGSTIPQFRNVYYGTEALTPGSSPLPEGTLYITPEMEYESAGKRTCRFVVGTSTAGWTAADCDYLCDGTADDVEINAALQALPLTGGEIVILDGTYSITATITVSKSYVTIRGNGGSSKIQRDWDAAVFSDYMLNVLGDNCTVSDLFFEGQSYAYTNENNTAVRFNGDSGRILNNRIAKNSGYGISYNGNNGIIMGNHVYQNAIGISFAGAYNEVNSNIVEDNAKSGISTGSFCGYATIADNVLDKNTENGLNLFNYYNGTITGNTVVNSGVGIKINGPVSGLVSVTGNTIFRGDGLPSDYTDDQHTISAECKNSLFTGNLILGKNYVDNGTNNTWANNKFE